MSQAYTVFEPSERRKSDVVVMGVREEIPESPPAPPSEAKKVRKRIERIMLV